MGLQTFITAVRLNDDGSVVLVRMGKADGETDRWTVDGQQEVAVENAVRALDNAESVRYLTPFGALGTEFRKRVLPGGNETMSRLTAPWPSC